jgi:hypothetical protein
MAVPLLAGAVLMLSGCSIAGEWRTKSVEPAGQEFPFYQVEFTSDGRYTAMGPPSHRERSSTGTYTWNGSTLKVMPKDGPERSYPGYRDIFKDQLVLKHEHEGKKMKATLEKVETQPK